MQTQVSCWTSKEIVALRARAHLGLAECARTLGRSPASVRAAAYRQRLSLRRTGSRAGILMNQPRGVSLKHELRDDLVHGRRDELLAERLKMDREAALCPECSYRSVRVAATGLCTVCHTRNLTRLHLELTADDEALRELWAARQRRRSKLDALDVEQMKTPATPVALARGQQRRR